jgi:NAD(P)-dependent dehydrogenase (short-subunit alcohol dehydrogenase family)
MSERPRLALVTGAASGIGRAFAIELARRGCRLLLVDIDERGLDGTLAQLGAADARALTVDISSEPAVRAMVDELADEVDALDLLVNCAAVLGDGDFAEQALSDFAKVIQVDLMGTVHVIHAALPWLRAARGRIIVMASTASLHGWPMLAAYSAAKGAVENYSEAIRAELRRDGVSVTTVFPLLVDTPLLARDNLPPVLEGRRVSALQVVERSLAAAERRQPRAFVPWMAKLVALAHGVAPPLLDWWAARVARR